MSFARVRQVVNSERILGNIGEPIDYDQWDEHQHLEEEEEETMTTEVDATTVWYTSICIFFQLDLDAELSSLD